MKEECITCTICPIGCLITARGNREQLESISGNGCKRGEKYARSEFIRPVRILTTTVKVSGANVPLVPVRSDKPLPKEMLFQCMAEIKKLVTPVPVHRHDILIRDILETGVNIIAAGTID